MSEYIPRLREELVAAAAREHAGHRRRPAVRPSRVALVVAAAAVAATFVLAVSAIKIADDERPVGTLPPATALTYRAVPAPGGDAEALDERAAEVLRARIAAAGITDARVSVANGRISVDAGAADRATIAALATPGTLGIYDWEESVLGPDGRPAPGDDSVTGGPGAGQEGSVPRYEAVLRAAKAQGTRGAPSYWLLDDTAREVIAGPQWSRDALTGGGSAPEGARVAEVPGGVRVVQAERTPPAGGWYAIADDAALGNADVADARAAIDPATQEPIVAFDFTAAGQRAFSELTREIAHRGADAQRPGEDPIRAAQHLAFVLDDRLVGVPFIDHQEVPDGIDGSTGAQISGGLSSQGAERIAIILNTGPMPVTLEPAP
jgi:SecD/SecF fusion protein